MFRLELQTNQSVREPLESKLDLKSVNIEFKLTKSNSHLKILNSLVRKSTRLYIHTYLLIFYKNSKIIYIYFSTGDWGEWGREEYGIPHKQPETRASGHKCFLFMDFNLFD